MNRLRPLSILAEVVESTDGGEAPKRGKVYAADGHEMRLPEWLNFQEAHMVQFVHQVLTKDPEMREVSQMSEDELEALRLTWRMMEEPPESILDSKEIRWLNAIPEAHRIMEDWLGRFGPLFNRSCRQQGYSAESGGRAVGAYQTELVDHVRELRRIIHMHTGQYRDVSELLAHVRSRVFGVADDGQCGEYLDFRTMFPSVRVGENGEGQELAALAARLESDDADLFTAPDDAYGLSVDGERRRERQKLVTLLHSTPEKIVLLDARSDFRVEEPLRVYKEDAGTARASQEGTGERPRRPVSTKNGMSV